jgi:hypothetical protein
MIDEEILSFNRLGLIPGPEENLNNFLYRADYCVNLQNTFDSKLVDSVPFSVHNQAPNDLLEEGFQITEKLYDIKPHWIPVFFSNYKLAFWHGGCAWIFQENETTPTGAFFQLRTAFKTSQTYLGLYKRNALIAHEFSHVGRMMFEEPRFEEVFAYRSDPSAFRRYFGPIMQSSWESALFVLFLFLIMMIDFSLSSLASTSLYQHFMWLKLIPFGMLLYALGRLYRKQRQFSHCLNNLQKIVSSKEKANGVIYRLTDNEICAFANMTEEQLREHIELNKDKTLRWQVITAAYLAP